MLTCICLFTVIPFLYSFYLSKQLFDSMFFFYQPSCVAATIDQFQIIANYDRYDFGYLFNFIDHRNKFWQSYVLYLMIHVFYICIESTFGQSHQCIWHSFIYLVTCLLVFCLLCITVISLIFNGINFRG